MAEVYTEDICVGFWNSDTYASHELSGRQRLWSVEYDSVHLANLELLCDRLRVYELELCALVCIEIHSPVLLLRERIECHFCDLASLICRNLLSSIAYSHLKLEAIAVRSEAVHVCCVYIGIGLCDKV